MSQGPKDTQSDPHRSTLFPPTFLSVSLFVSFFVHRMACRSASYPPFLTLHSLLSLRVRIVGRVDNVGK